MSRRTLSSYWPGRALASRCRAARRRVSAGRQGLALAMIMVASTAAIGAPLPTIGLLSGNLTSSGSDTLAAMMTGWAQDFGQHYPEVSVQIQAAGSATAATALASGTAQLGPMSRPMTATEIAAFRQHYHYAPVAVPVAIDAVVVLVNQANPLFAISRKQLDAIYSITRDCGQPAPIRRWGDLALGQGWRQLPLLRYGRNSASGTYGYFRQQALCGGDMLAQVNELPGASSVAQAVASSANAIGYTSMSYRASGVKTLAIVDDDGQPQWPDAANLRSGKYPLSRYLYIYVNKPPDRPMDPLAAAFLQHILSAAGQLRVRQAGYLPLPERVLQQLHRQLGLSSAGASESPS